MMRFLIVAAAALILAPASAMAQTFPDPFVIGATRLDPTQLQASAGEIGPNGVLAQGLVGYARTGTLVDAIESNGAVRFSATRGTRLHRTLISYAAEHGASEFFEAWCGQFTARAFGVIRNERTVCVQDDGARTLFYAPREEDSTLVSTGRFTLWVHSSPVRLRVIEDPPPTEAPFPIQIYLRGINNQRVIVEMEVRHDGDRTTIWQADIRYDESDTAVIPLWTHELRIHREDAREVSVELVEVGGPEGIGPMEAFPQGISQPR